ncbi:MAG: DUF86 domain-containing protein [Mucilaginibacter sp.]|nr:DUF86 domain-containing protein [Mucilaginibacter sp.]
MSRSDKVYVEDIIESIEIILSYIGDKTEFEFINNLMLQDAIIRRFEIIGEAASKISEPIKNQTPQVQWRLMKEMRNKLIHEYFGVSPVTIYSTIRLDLPVLLDQLNKLAN